MAIYMQSYTDLDYFPSALAVAQYVLPCGQICVVVGSITKLKSANILHFCLDIFTASPVYSCPRRGRP